MNIEQTLKIKHIPGVFIRYELLCFRCCVSVDKGVSNYEFGVFCSVCFKVFELHEWLQEPENQYPWYLDISEK